MSSLAVVIPAYKAMFLAQTLESLASQTNPAFSVYIGNDAGDEQIEDIVQEYAARLPIHYHRFSENMGRKSLVKQWERCLSLVQLEEWVWLLPDDDYADTHCVSLFQQACNKSSFDIFRFNVHFAAEDGMVFKTNQPLPPVQDAFENLLEKLSFSRPGTVAEFIFRRKKMEQIGFAGIPLAWGADDLLWFLMGREKGIHTCNEAFVYLRQSRFNISNDYKSLAKQKLAANFLFFEALQKTNAFKEEIKDERKKEQFAKIANNHLLYNLQDFSLKLGLTDMYRFAIKGNRVWGGGIMRNLRRFYLNNQRISRKAKNIQR